MVKSLSAMLLGCLRYEMRLNPTGLKRQSDRRSGHPVLDDLHNRVAIHVDRTHSPRGHSKVRPGRYVRKARHSATRGSSILDISLHLPRLRDAGTGLYVILTLNLIRVECLRISWYFFNLAIFNICLVTGGL